MTQVITSAEGSTTAYVDHLSQVCRRHHHHHHHHPLNQYCTVQGRPGYEYRSSAMDGGRGFWCDSTPQLAMASEFYTTEIAATTRFTIIIVVVSQRMWTTADEVAGKAHLDVSDSSVMIMPLFSPIFFNKNPIYTSPLCFTRSQNVFKFWKASLFRNTILFLTRYTT